MSGPVDEGAATLVVCRFVRERNALLCVADFGPMFMDCYLHLGQNSVVLAGGADEKLKLLLAALALHAAAQPRAVTCAWTLHLEKERWNIFAVAETPTGHVTGQVFAETRLYRFACGCTPERIAGAIWPALQGDLDGVFGGDGHIRVACPRCGMRHELPRELFEPFEGL